MAPPRTQPQTPTDNSAPRGLLWPVRNEARIEQLRAELAKPIPPTFCNVALPDKKAYDDAGSDEYLARCKALEAERARLKVRVLAKVTRLGSVAQERAENLQPSVGIIPLEHNTPVNRWGAFPPAVLEVYARCYYKVEQRPSKNPLHAASDGRTLAPGLIYALVPAPEYLVEVFDQKTGTVTVLDPDGLHKNRAGSGDDDAPGGDAAEA